ncbi:MAG: hypothetical protein M1820_003038 [Bogoriella megaspora]|nr:MAG: hypothetical protein M1820_003038 [Bogoriella megaspora]
MLYPEVFTNKKRQILAKLSRDEKEYTDKSPKGSVDEQIIDLVRGINVIEGLVTTSSCAGRISIYLESARQSQGQATTSADRGRWTFSSHSPLRNIEMWSHEQLAILFGSRQQNDSTRKSLHNLHPKALGNSRHILFKFEPMILHIFTASLEDAQKVLQAAISAGFRESGVVNLKPNADDSITPLVAVRSIALASETVIGYEDTAGSLISIVDDRYLRQLGVLANERFEANTERINKFSVALAAAFSGPHSTPIQKPKWEDPVARKHRKRSEGLQRQAEARSVGNCGPTKTGCGDVELSDSIFMS